MSTPAGNKKDVSEFSVINSEPAFFPTATVAIIGLGLIGGSLAYALHGRCARMLGIDNDPKVVKQAIDLKIVDRADTNPAELLPGADLVVIAVPVRASLEVIKQLPKLHPGHALVLDMGSTKRDVLQVMAELPDRFDPVGGHPMCGKESGRLANAEATLFKAATLALVPLLTTTNRAKAVAEELATLLGAKPIWIEAEQHDHWVAVTSHLPHLLATALALSTPPESALLIGPGFRSTSRLAAGLPDMKLDLLMTNRDAILEALELYQYHLGSLSELLRSGDTSHLETLLIQGAERRQALIEANDAILR